MSDSLSCPVSHIMVNGNRVRIIALFVFLSSLIYLLAPFWPVPAFLSIDFFLRAFGIGLYSPLNAASGWIVKTLSIANKPIDQAPKLFAAQLGFVFSVLLLTSTLFLPPTTSYIIAATLILFSFLESALGFCAGCHVYTILKKIRPA